MTREETKGFIANLIMAYPKYYPAVDECNMNILLEMWHINFENIPYKVVMLAFNQHLNSMDGKFPPVAGQLKELISRMNPKQEISSNEAYGLVYKAICNSGYYDNAIYEYNKLPKEIQKIISVDRLHQLAKSEDEASLVTFEATFKREYQKEIKNKQEFEALPLKQQENVLKLQAMTQDMFGSVVLGNKKVLEIEE